MKKIFMLCAAMFFSMTTMFAQEKKNCFNHLSVGINGGTLGYGLDAAMPVNNHFQLRAGFSVLPISINDDIDLDGYYPQQIASVFGQLDVPNEVEAQAKLKMANAKVLLDIFPSKRSSFHFTTGLYVGGGEILEVKNAQNDSLKIITQANENIEKWNQNSTVKYNKIGLDMGDYLLTADRNGNMEASLKTSSVKPYLGIGFGRAVPKNKSIGFMFELGTIFWGSPLVYCNNEKLEKAKVGNDAEEVLDIISKITVYPVLNFRLTFKAF